MTVRYNIALFVSFAAFLSFWDIDGIVRGQEKTMVVEGLSSPESALYDPQADMYLVSNMNGSPFDTDDNGFISRVAPDGRIVELKWIDGGKPDVTLHAPRGSAIKNDILYVADTGAIRLFDRSSGKPRGEWPIADSGLLNDVAIGHDGAVYATDTGVGPSQSGQPPQPKGKMAIYRFSANGARETVVQGEGLTRPNGIVGTPEGLVVVTLGAATVSRVESGGRLVTIATLPQGMFDGVVRLQDGSLLVSSLQGNIVYHVDRSGRSREVVTGVRGADIGFDTRRSRILIPVISANHMRIEPFVMPQ